MSSREKPPIGNTSGKFLKFHLVFVESGVKTLKHEVVTFLFTLIFVFVIKGEKRASPHARIDQQREGCYLWIQVVPRHFQGRQGKVHLCFASIINF